MTNVIAIVLPSTQLLMSKKKKINDINAVVSYAFVVVLITSSTLSKSLLVHELLFVGWSQWLVARACSNMYQTVIFMYRCSIFVLTRHYLIHLSCTCQFINQMVTWTTYRYTHETHTCTCLESKTSRVFIFIFYFLTEIEQVSAIK